MTTSGTRQGPESLLQVKFSGSRCYDRVWGIRCLLEINMFEKEEEEREKLNYSAGPIQPSPIQLRSLKIELYIRVVSHQFKIARPLYLCLP